ncbi:hypothetical protein Tco_1039384 [Tanacetum coccineum]
MKRISKGYSGVDIPLFPTMLTAPESSPSRITSSPSLSPQTHPSTSQPQTTFKVEDLQIDLQQTKKVYSSALIKLILRVKKLEKQVKTSKARRRVRLVLSEDEDAAEDSSKQGRKISEIDTDPSISLVQDEGPSWFQEDAEIQEKISDDTEVLLEEEEPTKIVEDQGSGEKGEKEVSTVGAEHSTVIPEVSTVAENLV